MAQGTGAAWQCKVDAVAVLVHRAQDGRAWDGGPKARRWDLAVYRVVSRLSQAGLKCMEHSAGDVCTRKLPSSKLACDSRASWCVEEG